MTPSFEYDSEDVVPQDRQNCTSSEDCIWKNEVGELVSKLCLERVTYSDEENFCQCSAWFGFRGEECDEVSPQVIYFRTIAISFLSYSVLMMLLIIAMILRTRKRLKQVRGNHRPFEKLPGFRDPFLIS